MRISELDETACWIELQLESNIMTRNQLASLQQEANELTAILVTCAKNAKRRKLAHHIINVILPPSAFAFRLAFDFPLVPW